MSPAIASTVAVALLLATLGFAVARPGRMSEAVIAVPAALCVILLGIEPTGEAWAVLVRFGPTVVFLAGILLLGHLAADAGVFRYLGSWAAKYKSWPQAPAARRRRRGAGCRRHRRPDAGRDHRSAHTRDSHRRNGSRCGRSTAPLRNHASRE